MRLARRAFLGVLCLWATAFAEDGAAVPPAPEEKPAPPEPALVTLRDAVKRGLVSAWGTEPQSYTGVRLHVKNLSGERLHVDIAGSHLVPRRPGSCQRLGLGPAKEPGRTRRRGAGTVVIDLLPGEKNDWLVNTCCLDAGKPAPSKHEFGASIEALPPVREKVLRWWADHPTAPQNAVNSAIWRFVDTVSVEPGIVPNFIAPYGRFAAIHRGLYYRLTDGVLTTVDEEGVVRILGSEVFQVLPTDDAVYAVMNDVDRRPKLWLVPMTGEERWRKVMDLDGTNRIREIVAARDGSLVLVTDKGVDYYDANLKVTQRSLSTEQAEHLSARRAGDGELAVTLRRPPKEPVRQQGKDRFETAPVFELWSVKLAGGRAERVQQHWTIEAMLAGPSGVYGLTHGSGKLRRLVGDDFRDVPGGAQYARIVGIGGDVVWLADREGRLVAVDAGSGAVRVRAKNPAEEVRNFDVDPHTGDLAWVAGEEFRWIRASDGREVTLP